ncbi:MAG: ComEC/Rec2 family competence protein [Hormoscilla sp. GM7CHS1pb]|nr:ComEC/Rec2 family competence protein [Hormoscilla sp. GM7CHS1pb]
MHPASGVIICLAYILGLLSTASAWGGYTVLVLAVAAPAIGRRFWRMGPKPGIWLAAGLVGLLASFYLPMRVPQPLDNDISQFVSTPITASAERPVVKIGGKVVSNPRLTRSGRAQFWLLAREFHEISGSVQPLVMGKEVTGKLYVTVPLLQATGLHPGRTVEVTGILYKPKPAANPGAFDFKDYLAREGSFAGMNGDRLSMSDAPGSWGWWQLRQRIVRAQVRSLGVPEGIVVSAMVLGRKAVDLPYDIRDRFINVGLAHVLAASGFHVSLLLFLVLTLTRRLSVQGQFTFGLAALIIYVGLTGFQPSVLRAAVMGFGALLALLTDRKVKPLGSLLLAAVLLLAIDPQWIWNLGFQLSFLATLGLVVTVPGLVQRLDWLPPAIASTIAVPLAASIWTLPLLLYSFGQVSPYSIFVNIITTPLISAIALGGFISALAAVIWPAAGSAIAWLLYHPTHWLIQLVEFGSQLPGNSLAIGNISLWQLLLLYGLIGAVWLLAPRKQNQFILSFSLGLAIALIIIPAMLAQATMFRVTVLATSGKPVIVIQDRGEITLVNSGDESTALYTILPFLQQQGVNHIDWAIATSRVRNNRSGWFQIFSKFPIQQFYDILHLDAAANQVEFRALQEAIQEHEGKYQPLPLEKTLQIGSTSVKLINFQPQIISLQILDQTWLLLADLKPADQNLLLGAGKLPKAEVIWWPGSSLNDDLLSALQPQVAIASAGAIDENTRYELLRSKTKLYSTEQNGAIQWTPENGFETTIDLESNFAENGELRMEN